MAANKGNKHHNWKGGIIVKGDYRKILTKSGNSRIRKYTMEHHINWCIANSLPVIPQGCVVHHINGNRLDNRPENLALLPKQYHDEAHWYFEKQLGINRFGGD